MTGERSEMTGGHKGGSEWQRGIKTTKGAQNDKGALRMAEGKMEERERMQGLVRRTRGGFRRTRREENGVLGCFGGWGKRVKEERMIR